MTRARARRGAHSEIGIFHQPRAGLGMTNELDTGIEQCLPDPATGMRLVAINGNDGGLLPVGDRIRVETGSTSKLIPRPIEQAACRADLGAGDDAA
jgi:hypothetical protein